MTTKYRNNIYKNCLVCSVRYFAKDHGSGEVKYCSMNCYRTASKGRARRPMSETTKRKISRIAKEQNRGWWRKGMKMSDETRAKMSAIRYANPVIIKGESHYNWRGGVTPVNEKIRKSVAYRKWRISVFERDDYTCQICGQKGGELNADHIKPFALFPELRLDVRNGRTLCQECHIEHGWMPRRKTEDILSSQQAQ